MGWGHQERVGVKKPCEEGAPGRKNSPTMSNTAEGLTRWGRRPLHFIGAHQYPWKGVISGLWNVKTKDTWMTGDELVTGNKRKFFQEFRAQRSKYILGEIASKRSGVKREAHAHFLRELLLGKPSN